MDLITYEFLDVFKDVTSKYSKIPKKKYLSEGLYAIVDQGKDLISGYTNNQKLINTENKEVVIFGDHTRILKFIDFPIAIGADGVKVLQVDHEKADSRFIYYYLKSLRIQDAGYSRHYKFLKRKSLIVPESITDQKRIAKVLSDCEQLIQWRKESIKLLDDYLESTFLEMFGGPGQNSKKWEIKKFEDHIDYIGDIGSNGSNAKISKNLIMHDEENHALMVRTTNLKSNDFVNKVKYFSKETYEFFSKSKIYGGEIIMNKIGSAGEFWLMPYLNRPVSLGLNQLVIRLKDINTDYLFYYYSSQYGKQLIRSKVKGAVTKSITKGAVKELPLMFPPIEIQNEFSAIVKKAKSLKSQLKLSLTYLENLFGSLSQKAFKGELKLAKVKIQEPGVIVIKNQKIYGGKNQFSDSIINTGRPSETQKVKTKDSIIQDASELSVKELFLSGRSAEVNWTNYLSRKDFNLEDDPLNYLYALYYTFKEREFSFQEIELKTAASLMLSTNIDYDWKPEEWKKKIFQYLNSKPPYLVQLFNEQEGRIKLKVNYEALTV